MISMSYLVRDIRSVHHPVKAAGVSDVLDEFSPERDGRLSPNRLEACNARSDRAATLPFIRCADSLPGLFVAFCTALRAHTL
jgi:hypothetical protein